MTHDATPDAAPEAAESIDAPSEAAESAPAPKRRRLKTRKKSTTHTAEPPAAPAEPVADAAAGDAPDAVAGDEASKTTGDAGAEAPAGPEAEAAAPKPKRKRSRSKKKTDEPAPEVPEASDEPSGDAGSGSDADGGDAAADTADTADADDEAAPAPSRKKKKVKTKKKRSRGRESEVQSTVVEPAGDEVMVINDLADDECRIAVLEDGHLEEIFVERSATATNVGNIYKGRVVNVEPAIQAAFVDYGQGANGFLHISDLHPRYFPGSGSTERVGKKTPRRERPSIQEALKRGQEILVQVLKEGIGSKGPTLTSYLSIPGRLLVMMPDMDRVGVTRKIDDDDSRREMRKILDALDLPDGFGFILRTAGMGRTKTEIKRDVAYLTRLWRQMEKRIDKVGAPCPLYTESDLVIRTVRDVLRPSIKAIVVDSQSAYERVSAFLRVVAPRSAPRVVRYARSTPIFHAFGVERQIELIHSREVPLRSGGALVIEQTEALVAIDVNSGKSRSARDSETNAYRTNCEAVDEIARQLRLRDLGGLVVNDLIDMRHARHRKAIEDRFRENLKRDRARTSISRISEFGLIEMTRQRMRPSLRSGHFTPCPTCQGRGEVQAPDSLGADVIRHVALYLDQPRVQRLEIVCSPRVSSVLLSRKRRDLVHLEDHTGKAVDVRVSDDIPVDRVDYYAYDERNADLDLMLFQPRKHPKLEVLEKEAAELEASLDDDVEGEEGEGGGRRRRRRRRKPAPADATAIALSEGLEEELAAIEEEEAEEAAREAAEAAAAARGRDDEDRDRERSGDAADGEDEGEGGGRKRRRRRRRRRRKGGEDGEAGSEGGAPEAGGGSSEPARTPAPAAAPAPEPEPEPEPMKVFELAKVLELKSRAVLDAAIELGIEAKSHMKRLTGEEVGRLRAHLAPPAPTPAPEPAPDPAGNDGGGDASPDSSDDGGGRHEGGDDDGGGDGEGGGRKRRRRRRRRRRKGGGDGDGGDGGGAASGDRGADDRRDEDRAPAPAPDPAAAAPAPPAPSGSSRRSKKTNESSSSATTTEPKPRRRPLYGSRKRVARTTVIESQDS